MLEGVLEGALARGAGTHAVGGGVDHFRAGELRQHIEHRAGEHIATAHGLVLEDAVVEQVNGAALVHAQQRRIGRAGEAVPVSANQTNSASCANFTSLRIWPSASNSGSADRRQNWKPPPRPSTAWPLALV
jgi:hypothetical protein